MTLQELQKMTLADLKIEHKKAQALLTRIRFLVKSGQEQGHHKLRAASIRFAQILSLMSK